MADRRIRVCRSADWYTELAFNPDGRLEFEIEHAYDILNRYQDY